MEYYEQAKADIEALAESLDLWVDVEFVPLSRSRNAKEKRPTVNWRYRLYRGKRPVNVHGSALAHEMSKLRPIDEGDYSQGVGHLKGPKGFNFMGRTVDDQEAIRGACETGRARFESDFIHKVFAVPPTLVDILGSLCMDASAIDEGSFENWADSLGYDRDSRKGEAIYRACVDTALRLRAAIGDEALTKLRDLAYQL